MDVTCGYQRGFQTYRTPNGCDVTVFRGAAKSVTLTDFMAVSDAHRWNPIGTGTAPGLQRARMAAALHRARLRPLLEQLVAAHDLDDEAAAAAQLDSQSHQSPNPPPAEVDVKVLVAAPSAPPLLFAPISTLEANTR